MIISSAFLTCKEDAFYTLARAAPLYALKYLCMILAAVRLFSCFGIMVTPAEM